MTDNTKQITFYNYEYIRFAKKIKQNWVYAFQQLFDIGYKYLIGTITSRVVLHKEWLIL